MKNIIYILSQPRLMALTLVLIISAQANAQFSQLSSGTSYGAEWTSGGALTTFGVAGQIGVATHIEGGDYTGSIGFVFLSTSPVTNLDPVAFGTPGEIFYELGSIYKMDGVDPDGEDILYEVLTQTSLGTLSFPDPGIDNEVIFTPDPSLLTGVLYHDSFTFRVEEAVGGTQSETALVEFSFKLPDAPHQIASFTKSNDDFIVEWTDLNVNPVYNIKVKYFDLTDPNNPVVVSVADIDVDDTEYNLNTNVLDYTISTSASVHPYLFNTDLVFVTLELNTPGGFSDFGCYVLDNTDPSAVQTLASSDGLFFALGTEQSVPEKNSVFVQIGAVELGSFDIAELDLQLTSSPDLGTLSQPILIETSANLFVWEAEYTATEDVGGFEEITFSVYHPERDITETGQISITIEESNDPPVLNEIFSQKMLEDGTLDIEVSATDPDNAVAFTAMANNDEDKVVLSVNGTTLTVTPVADYTGTINISGVITEIGTTDLYSVSQSFDVEILPQNDAPVLDALSNESIDEDVTLEIQLSATDLDGDVLVFDYEAVIDNPAIASAVVQGSSLSIVPVDDAVGQVSISVTADDRTGASNSESAPVVFTVDFNPVNDQPVVVQTLGTQTMVENSPGYDLDLSAYFSDVETASTDLAYSTTGNTNVLFSFSGSVATITTTADYFGTETITIKASDSEFEAEMIVDFVVNQEDPNLQVSVAISDIMLDEDFGSTVVDVSGVFEDITDSEAVFTYEVSGTNFVTAAVDNANQTVTISSALDVSEDETILLVGTTGGTSVFTEINLLIASVNDAPQLGNFQNISIFEDGSLTNLLMEVTDVDDAIGSLIVTAVSDNQDVIADEDISVDFVNGFYYLSATSLENVFGTTNITVTVSDNDLEDVSSFMLSLLSVNDVPTVVVESTIDGATEDVGYTADLSTLFSDIDGDGLEFEVDNLPTWLTLGGSSISGTPENADVGSTEILITANDASGASIQSIYDLSVENVNDAPSFDAAATPSLNEDETLSQFLIDVEDVDNDFSDLIFTISSTDETILSNEDLSFSSAGGFLTITASPLPDQYGTVGINFTANDGDKIGSRTIEFVIENVNDAPVAVVTTVPNATENDAYEVSLANFFTDIDEDVLELSLSDNPAWLSITSNNVLTGTPLNGDVGEISFEILADDGGLTVSQTYSMQIGDVNNAPSAAITTIPNATENAEYEVSLGNFFTDLDEDVLELSLSDNPAWLSITSNNVLTGTPLNGDVGEISFEILADDGEFTISQTYSMTIGDVNNAPFAAITTIPNATENVEYEVSLANFFTDLDEDVLVLSLSDNPAWLSITLNNVLIGTPQDGDVGEISFTILADDGEFTASQTYTLTIGDVNNAPNLENAVGDLTTDQNSAFTYAISNTTFSDVDINDVLTLSIEAYPSWATLTDGVLAGTPSYGDIGTYSITISATDEAGLSIEQTFELVVQFVVYDTDFTASNDATCPGESTLIVATGAIDYNWYSADGSLLQEGGDSFEIAEATSMQVVIEGKDDQDRANPTTLSYDLSLNSTPDVPVITQGTSLSVEENANLTYQWYLNDELIAGATSSSITPEAEGNYSIEVTNESGCSASSESVPFSITGLVFDKVELQIYPVPATTTLTIEAGVNPSELEFSVYDIKGARMPLNSSVSSNKIVLDVTKYRSGIYILNTKYRDTIKSVKFTKE